MPTTTTMPNVTHSVRTRPAHRSCHYGSTRCGCVYSAPWITRGRTWSRTYTSRENRFRIRPARTSTWDSCARIYETHRSECSQRSSEAHAGRPRASNHASNAQSAARTRPKESQHTFLGRTMSSLTQIRMEEARPASVPAKHQIFTPAHPSESKGSKRRREHARRKGPGNGTHPGCGPGPGCARPSCAE
jgi:hypothetical protein